jgi:hypothetical protein
LTELPGSILNGELGVLEIGLGAVHEVFQRLVLRGVLLAEGCLRDNRRGARLLVGVQLCAQFGCGDGRRREVLRGSFEPLDYQRSQRGDLGLSVWKACHCALLVEVIGKRDSVGAPIRRNGIPLLGDTWSEFRNG